MIVITVTNLPLFANGYPTKTGINYSTILLELKNYHFRHLTEKEAHNCKPNTKLIFLFHRSYS